MKIAHTSVIVFFSKVVSSALGFVGTLYFARLLGPEILGLFALVTTMISWFGIVADLGIGGGMLKRISEGTEQGEFLSAAALWILTTVVILSAMIVLAQSVVESYVGSFDSYVDISVVWFVIAMLCVSQCVAFIFRILEAQRMVHVQSLLQMTNTTTRSLLQIGLVTAGFGLLGMLLGWIVGTIFISAIALYWVQVQPARPAKRHFRSLFDYAKFSWLGKLKSRAFNDVDILLLGVFVQTSLVGVYSIAWSISKFLSLFGNAIRSTLFPELSYTSAQESGEAAAGLVEDSLAYTGLIVVPGFVGGIILDDRLLRLYSPEFVEGTRVLVLMILAILLFSYQQQLMNGLNGLDRPDLAFRVNAVFISLNAGLNVALIWQYGIKGAAVASVLSTGVSLILSYYMLSQLISFKVPYAELTYQWVAALTMGVAVFGGRKLLETTVSHNAIIVVSLVGLGAAIYFLTLLAISAEFRATVNRNIPIEVPYLS